MLGTMLLFNDEKAHMLGTMLWFNDEKGYGVITTDDEEKIAVSSSGFVDEIPPRGQRAGRPVTFVVVENGDSRRAEQVQLVEEVAPRRARMRHSGR
jgi:cold shock CspA family protein